MRNSIAKVMKLLGSIFLRASERLLEKSSVVLKMGKGRDLYQLPSGQKMWLNQTGYIDRQIIQYGVFEPLSTGLIRKCVRPGDVVVDVGANIGYYTIIFSELVGASGKVFAFEPTKHFREVLERNIEANGCENVDVVPYGLSDQSCQLVIDIGPSSATLHSPEGYDKVLMNETIELKTLSEFVSDNEIKKIDFIKIDIDGHEPRFFDGAWEILKQFDATILFEISHLHYLEAGVTAWDFYERLKDNNYYIYHEEDGREIVSRNDFLRSCADFSSSCNLVISRHALNI